MILSLLISLISGMVLTLAFPRTDAYLVAWAALAPLFYLSVRRPWLIATLCGFVFGLGFFGSILWWIGIFGRLPFVLLTIMQALYIAAFALTANLIAGRLSAWGRLIVVPALWVAFEWIRSQGLFGFTWGDLGYSQGYALSVIQIASVTGVWGVSFLVAMVNSMLANIAGIRVGNRRGSLAQLAVTAGLLAAVIGHGMISLNVPLNGKSLTAAVIQGNINQDTEEDLDYSDRSMQTYRQMTLDAAAEGAALIIWPETSMPGAPGYEPYLQGWLSALSLQANAPLIVGGRDEDIRGHVYNSAFLVGPGKGILARYAKVRLVPFGEFVPWRQYLPRLDNYRVTPMDVTPGRGFNLLDGGPCRIGVAICFESTFPYISRALTASGAELLCVITNDVWFRHSAAAEQHAEMSILRAVENRRYLLRGAATGVSCIIDPRGRVMEGLPIFEQGTISATVECLRAKTFYTRHGDWFAWATLLLVGLACMVAARRREVKE